MHFRLTVSLAMIAWLLSAAASSARSADALDPARAVADADGTTLWYDAKLLNVEGRAWNDTAEHYDRLPAKAEELVRPSVWNLSRNSAGMCVRFVADAPTIKAKWTLRSTRLAMAHMPATGVSGVDLYVRTDNDKWHWLGTGIPAAQTNAATLARGIPAGPREYLLYLPLYNGVTSVEIGIPRDAALRQAAPRDERHAKPIVFYGTSITQGGCASRPGMPHPAIVGRRFDRPVVNLGFSGNGRMELEVAKLMGEIDAAVYVVDCLPNISARDVAERTEPVVRELRKARPDVPILLVEDLSYAQSFLLPASRNANLTRRKELKDAFNRLRASGVKELYYLEGDGLLDAEGEGTVDGTHPTDLGFTAHANAFEKSLRPILER